MNKLLQKIFRLGKDKSLIYPCPTFFKSYSSAENVGTQVETPKTGRFGPRGPRTASVSRSQLITRLVNMRVVKNMTVNGKVAKFSAIVVAGNGNGGIGCGHAKHTAASEAVTKAGKVAVKSMEYFHRWQDRTLFHDDYVKFKATKLFVRPAAPNTGRRCHPTIAEMCRCLGIKDISAKVHGSSHPMNVMKAFLEILKRQKTPEQVAADSGMRVVDVLKTYETGCRMRAMRGDHKPQMNK